MFYFNMSARRHFCEVRDLVLILLAHPAFPELFMNCPRVNRKSGGKPSHSKCRRADILLFPHLKLITANLKLPLKLRCYRRTTSVLAIMSCNACFRCVNPARMYPIPSGISPLTIFAKKRPVACMNEIRWPFRSVT